MVTRIDRDATPLLFAGPDNEPGGLVNDYPTFHESWSGNKLGDLFLGAKFNLTSQRSRRPLALAIRTMVKAPTADKDSGTGTGEWDGFFDVILSREFKALELSGFTGVAMRGDPEENSISDGIRWGLGTGFPSRGRFRGTAEVSGEWMFDHAVVAPEGLLVAPDGSLSPSISRLTNEVTSAIGMTWQAGNGVLFGVALTYRADLEPASDLSYGSGDALGLQFRLGFHRGVKVYVPPPPAIAAAPTPPSAEPRAPVPAPAANRPPSVRIRCEPCAVEPGGTIALRAETSDPDGDALRIVWSVTGGTLTDINAANTQWRADISPGLVTFTASVEDTRGAKASDTLTVQVTSEGEGLSFSDVLFEFDSSTLRPSAISTLEPVLAALRQRPEGGLLIEGHTCNVGTSEYNLALGERRAAAVRDYLVRRGITANRLTTISYGEERPSHDNSEEAGRRLNRRASFVLRATDALNSR
jgi:peptidoglycan-associated lipoprotein